MKKELLYASPAILIGILVPLSKYAMLLSVALILFDIVSFKDVINDAIFRIFFIIFIDYVIETMMMRYYIYKVEKKGGDVFEIADAYFEKSLMYYLLPSNKCPNLIDILKLKIRENLRG